MNEILLKKEVLQKNWKVVYTRPRWEKKVEGLLTTMGLESYCPVRKEYHNWADRKKLVEVPLFSSYVFVNCNAKEELYVRNVLGVMNFVYYQSKPAIVACDELLRIKYFVEHIRDIEIVNINQLEKGDRALIKSGAFVDKVGEILQLQGKHVIMAIESLGCAIITKVAVNNIILT